MHSAHFVANVPTLYNQAYEVTFGRLLPQRQSGPTSMVRQDGLMPDADVMNALSALAAEYVQAQHSPLPAYRTDFQYGLGDRIYDGMPDFTDYFQAVSPAARQAASQAIQEHPDLGEVSRRQGEEDPIFVSDNGSGRESPDLLVHGIFSAALRRLYFESKPLTVERLRTYAVENFLALKAAVGGKAVTTYSVYGLTGATLPPQSSIRTPWGVLWSAPELSDNEWRRANTAATTAVLMSPKKTQYSVSREKDPPLPPALASYYDDQRRIEMLLPLAFILGTGPTNRSAPQISFRTEIEPFRSGGGGSLRPQPLRPQASIDAAQSASVEEWAQRLGAEHVNSLDVAARRLVTAIGERSDKADVLIDAVTVWESLVGHNVETVFRVTVAMGKLLEPDPASRPSFVKKLRDVYNHRSAIVHGRSLDPQLVSKSADVALDVAVSAMKAVYARGGDWLSMDSQKRGESLIIAE